MTTIHPTAIIDDGAQLGDGVSVGPYSHIGSNVTLGNGVTVHSHVVIDGYTELGAGSEVYPFSVIGAPPQDLKFKGSDVRLRIGERNIIREHCTMHPGTELGRRETIVGNDGFFMVGTHIAHDCIIGDDVIFANSATIGGHVSVGNQVMMGGLCAIHQHVRIGRNAFVGGGAILTQDVVPFGSAIGNHAHLGGLNLVGLKRRGFSRAVIDDIRAAYRLLFGPEGTFQERLEDVTRVFAERPEVMEMVDFIREGKARSLCMPA